MTAMLHLVADDANFSGWKSRAGGYNFSAPADEAGTNYPGDKRNTFRRSSALPFNTQANQKPAFPLVPPVGQVRTYELIAQHSVGGSLTLKLDGSGTSKQELTFSGAFALHSFTALLNNGTTNDSFSINNYAADDNGYHYYTWIADFTGTALAWTLYFDGALIGSHTTALTAAAGWTLPTQTPAFVLNYATSQSRILELLVHDQALSADDVLARTYNFRTFA